MAEKPKYKIVLGANSDNENLEKLSEIFNKFQARFIVEEIKKYPEAVQEQLFDSMRITA